MAIPEDIRYGTQYTPYNFGTVTKKPAEDIRYGTQYTPYNFGTVTKKPAVGTNGYHQGRYEGVPNTLPTTTSWGIPTTEDMELAEKIATSKISNPSGITNIQQTNEMSYVTRAQNESRELENSDISGSHLGKNLDIQGYKNKAWGKDLEEV